MRVIPRLVALVAMFVVALSIPTAAADPITLMWDANPPEEEVLGYLVRVLDQAGNLLVDNLNVGNQTFFVFPDAIAGQRYVFFVAAYNVSGVGLYEWVSGFSDAPPALVSPGDLATPLGEATVLQLEAVDIYGDPITYGATGLPPGLTLNQSTGLITGTGTTAGAYSVTISATDGLLTTEVTFTWYVDGALPVVAITSPTTQPTYTTGVSSIAVGGTANDDVGIASVTWANSRGGVGDAALMSSTTWLIPSLTLKVGDNIITITARDFAGGTATAAFTVTFAGGAVPAVVIDHPTTAPTFTTSSTSVLLTGTASPGLMSMTWSTDRGASGNANYFKPPAANFSIWNIPAVPLQPGVNVITVAAQDTFEAIGTAVLTVTLNRAPVITNPGTQSSLSGTAVTLPIIASDLDGNPLTWTASGLPPGLSIDPSTGVVSGTPLEPGLFWIDVSASDGIASGVETFPWTVNAGPLTPTVTAADKAYDGTTTATLTSCTVAGLLTGHVVACTGAAAFDSATAGPGKPVTASGLTLTGPDAGNYTLASTIAGTTAAITPLPVTPVVTAANKTYDGTTSATLTSCTVAGAVSGDVLDCGATIAFDTASAGTGKTVSAVGLWLTGAAANNYFLSTETATTTAAITPRSVTPAVTVADKAYDGTTGATLTSCTLSGVIGGDAVGCTGTAAFDIASAGAGNGVTVSGLTLTGTAAGNYVPSATTVSTTAAITTLNVTPTAAAADKPYDGTTSAALTSCTVTGAIPGDVVGCAGTATFDTAGVGAGKTVTASGLTLIGSSAGNYVLSTPTAATTASITTLMVTPLVTAADKAYDRMTTAALSNCTLNGAPGGDAVGCTGVAVFDTAGVGAGKTVTVSGITLTGAAAGNYALASTTASTTAAITALTVTPAVTAANKVYDSTTTAALTDCTVTGALAGDVVACTGTAAFDTASAGTGKIVTASGLTLTGLSAGNYILSSPTATTNASVTTLTVTPVVTAASKPYDGTTTATLSSCALNGAPVGDAVGCTGVATFDTAGVGAAKTVTVSGIVLTGAAAGNYVLGSTTATTAASISALTVTPAVTAANKIYDGTTSATLTGCTVTGAVAGDVVTCTGTAAFDSADAGIGKTVTVSGLTLTGAAAGNYVLSSTTATTTATITNPDATAPTLTVTTPTSTGTHTTTSETIVVSGTASDNVAVTQVSWATSLGASGVATGTSAWSIAAVPLGAGTTVITVTARDAANNTVNGTLTVTYLPPAAATLIAPSGTIGTASPSFSWTAVSGASHYQLWVNDESETPKIDVTYTAAAAGCGTAPGTCSVSPGVTLAAGSAMWWVRPSNSAGATPWGAGLAFSVPTPPDTTAPAVAVATPTSTGTYTATSATLAVSGIATDSVGVTQVSWTTNNGASGVASGTTAWSIAAVPLATGTTVLTVTARDAASNTASATLTITYTPQPPGAATLLAPTGTIATATPSFSWTAVSNATEYLLWVNDANTGAKINTTYSAAAAGCGAGTGTCAVGPGVTLASGVATWWIRPSNGVGPGPWGAGFSFTVPAAPDNTVPTVALTTPTSTGTYTATTAPLAVSGTAGDNIGVTQVSWTTNGGSSGVASGTSAWTIAALPLATGTTVLTVTARDAANNTATATLTVTYNTVVPPAAATLIAPTGTIGTSTPGFSWTAVSGATHYQLWVNDASTGAKINTTYPAAAVGCGTGTGTCTVNPGVPLASGAALWWIRTSNTAGGTWSAGVAFTVPTAPDTTVPTVAVTMPTSTGTYTATSGTLAVSGAASDNVGVTQVSWTTNGGASGIATGTTAWSIAAVPLGAGTTVITVTARDTANNTASATLTVTFTLPSLPPAPATLLTPTGTIGTATPSFSWTAVSNATEYQLWVNDASTGAKIITTYPAAAVGCGAGTGTCTVSPGVTLASGAATWWIRTSNTAGGTWSTGLAFTVPAAPDTTAPSIAVTTPTSTGTYTATSGTLAVSGTASDNVGVTQVSWTTNGGASGIATGTTAWSIAAVPLGAGTTILTVTARDAANQTASATLTVTFTLPSLPPAAATLIAPAGTTATATPSFSWAAVSAATEYLLWVNDASTGAKIYVTYTAAAAGCGSGTGTCMVSPGVPLAPGAALWWIRTSNAAGSAWSTGSAFTVPGP